MDRITRGKLTFLTQQPQEMRQDLKHWGEFAMKLFLSGFGDSKSCSQLHPLTFALFAASAFAVVAVLMEVFGTACAFLRARLLHVA